MERKWWTLIAVSVATFMLLLDITVVNVALPSIREDLGASFTDLQWVVDAYALTLAALVLTAGSLADRLGRRRLFAAGLVIFSVASLVETSRTSQGFEWMLLEAIARQGLLVASGFAEGRPGQAILSPTMTAEPDGAGLRISGVKMSPRSSA